MNYRIIQGGSLTLLISQIGTVEPYYRKELNREFSKLTLTDGRLCLAVESYRSFTSRMRSIHGAGDLHIDVEVETLAPEPPPVVWGRRAIEIARHTGTRLWLISEAVNPPITVTPEEADRCNYERHLLFCFVPDFVLEVTS